MRAQIKSQIDELEKNVVQHEKQAIQARSKIVMMEAKLSLLGGATAASRSLSM